MNQTTIIVIVIWVALSAAFSYYATTKGQPAAKVFYGILFVAHNGLCYASKAH